MTILNCLTDEKFFNSMIQIFESEKGSHSIEYAILTDTQVSLNHIKCDVNIRQIPINHFIEYVANNGIDAVIIHNLRSVPQELIWLIPAKVKVIWFGWGFDLYTWPDNIRPLIRLKTLILPKTKNALTRIDPLYRLRELHAFFYNLLHIRDTRKIIERIDYFAGVFPIEFDLIKINHGFHAKKLIFNYGCSSSDYQPNKISEFEPCTGLNILLGNSGDVSNNHLDVMEELACLNLKSRKIIVPLSYGGSQAYKDIVKSRGKELWGENFVALDTFLPLNEYKRIISSCGNVIMGHIRQQASENIEINIWNGRKVFFYESSIGFKHYSDLGFIVRSIEHNLTNEELNKPLTLSEAENNRRIMVSYNGTDANISNFHKIISTLEADIKSQMK